jgi:cobalt-zinc-cadmium efflux system membrane fusion protein
MNKSNLESLMNARGLLSIFVMMLALLFATSSIADEDNEEEEERPEYVVLSPEQIAQHGIVTASARPGTLSLTSKVYGRVAHDPATLSHIRARFEGVVKRIMVSLGDSVKKGDPLVTVESNESLNQYTITSPMAGKIIARHANDGELTNGQILLSVANYSRAIAKLAIFPSQRARIEDGMGIWLTLNEQSQQSRISHITSSPDDKPYSIAFVNVDNSSGYWPLGSMIQGDIQLGVQDVELSLPRGAIQELDGQTIVFVNEGERFFPRQVLLGRTDGRVVEIIAGIQSGQQVVVENSYLLKADLLKMEAGDDD